MHTLKLACNAMATRFEILLQGPNKTTLQAAAEEALQEIQWTENQLTTHKPHSQIQRANQHAAQKPIKLEPTIFQLLQHTQTLTQQTQRAFDITLPPLLHAWNIQHNNHKQPNPQTIQQAHQTTGPQHIQLNPQNHTIHYTHPHTKIDLAAIGKGYALDRAKQTLQQNNIQHAILHGGTSAITTINTPYNQPHWTIAITKPTNPHQPQNQPNQPKTTIALAHLNNNALAVSAIWGKTIHNPDGTQHGHILNPKTGKPTNHTHQTAIIHNNATDADALATALLAAGKPLLPHLKKHHPQHSHLLHTQNQPTHYTPPFQPPP